MTEHRHGVLAGFHSVAAQKDILAYFFCLQVYKAFDEQEGIEVRGGFRDVAIDTRHGHTSLAVAL